MLVDYLKVVVANNTGLTNFYLNIAQVPVWREVS